MTENHVGRHSVEYLNSDGHPFSQEDFEWISELREALIASQRVLQDLYPAQLKGKPFVRLRDVIEQNARVLSRGKFR